MVESTPAVADLNGDGTSDLVFWYQGTLHALDGRDGGTLWIGPKVERLPQASPWSYTSNLPVVPAVGDLDGDGRPEVVVHSTRGQLMGVTALSGGDGRKLWEWTGKPGEDIRALSPPQMVRRDAGARVCIAIAPTHLTPKDPHFYVELDGRGQEVHRSQINWDVDPIWIFDADGDGSEELLLRSGGRVALIRDDPARPVWTFGSPQYYARVREVTPGRSGKPGQVVISSSQLIGLDAGTGAVRWRCPDGEILVADGERRRTIEVRGGMIRAYAYEPNPAPPFVVPTDRPPDRWRRPQPHRWQSEFEASYYIAPAIVLLALGVMWWKRWRWLLALALVGYVLFPTINIALRVRNHWLAKEPEEWYDWPRVLDIGPPYTELAVSVTAVIVPVVVTYTAFRLIRRYRRWRKSRTAAPGSK
jgi:hypothetical protein